MGVKMNWTSVLRGNRSKHRNRKLTKVMICYWTTWTTRTPLNHVKHWGEYTCSGRVNSSCSVDIHAHAYLGEKHLIQIIYSFVWSERELNSVSVTLEASMLTTTPLLYRNVKIQLKVYDIVWTTFIFQKNHKEHVNIR